MEDLIGVLRTAQLWLFVTLMVAAIVQWRRHRDRPSAWLAATFVSLGVVVVAGRLTDDNTGAAAEWEQKALIAVLGLFPYCLYRFSATLVPPKRWVEWTANVLTVGAVTTIFLFSSLPEDDEPRTAAFQLYVTLLLVQWVFCCGRVAYRLWDAGKGQPTVARRRMRTLSLGSAGIAATLLIAGAAQPTDDPGWLQLTTQVLALLTGPLFLLGFAPPTIVRALWRRREDEELARAERTLIAATTPGEVAQTLLEPVSRLVGGQGAALLDNEGRVIGYHGLDRYRVEEISAAARQGGESLSGTVMAVPMHSGWLAVQASRFTPFFGREEVDLVQRLADRADVALDRARGQQAIREQAELLDLARDAIFVRELDGTIRYWNAGAERMYGYAADQAIGRKTQELLDTDFPVPFDEIVAALEAEGQWEGELVHRRSNGRQITVSSRWAMQRGGDAVLELTTDVSERKRQEELRDRFIANAAHELRTPLTSLLGFIDLLGDDWTDTPEADREMLFDGIRRAGDRLHALVNSLLDLTRVQARDTALPVKPTPVAPICKEVAATTPLPEGVEVEVDADDAAVALVDPQRLYQILTNLLTNAYRYGGKTVCLAARQNDSHVRLTVTDDGPGVDDNLQLTLFEPFARGTKSTSQGGSGLGLAIVKTLVVSMGGDVWYEPAQPTGAVFNVRLRGAPSS